MHARGRDSAKRSNGIRCAAPCRDYHGRQWTLGGRAWASARGRAPARSRSVAQTIRAAGEIGIKIVTIFSFSAENWSRPPSEIGELMGLLRRFVRNDLAELHKSNVRVRVIGERLGLEPDIGRLLVEAEELTKNNDGLTLVVAFNYGARQEIVRATRAIAAAVKQGRLERCRHRHGYVHAISGRARHPRTRSDHPHKRREAVCRIFCSGRLPIVNSFSCRRIGPISTGPRLNPRSRNINNASGGSAASSPRPDPESWSVQTQLRVQTTRRNHCRRAISLCGSFPPSCWRRLPCSRPIWGIGHSRCSGAPPRWRFCGNGSH